MILWRFRYGTLAARIYAQRWRVTDIAGRIVIVRGRRVILDAELARLYGTETRVLNQAVRRNRDRFPGDFIIELTNQEVARSRSQSVILNSGRGSNVKHPPLAFSEHGAIMAATVLNSPHAVQMTVYVVRAFVQMRSLAAVNAQLAARLEALEKSVAVLDADARRQFREVRALVFALAMPAGKEQ